MCCVKRFIIILSSAEICIPPCALEYPLYFSLLTKYDESSIMKRHLFNSIENFTAKNWKFSDKNSDIFHISAKNIDCGFSLELPCWGSSNKYL